MKTYICTNCGAMRRAPNLSSPRCNRCGGEMVVLTAEQAQAAHKLSPKKRLLWLVRGARYKRGHGKKRWVPII